MKLTLPGCAFCAPRPENTFFDRPCGVCRNKAHSRILILREAGLIDEALGACGAFYHDVEPSPRDPLDQLVTTILFERRYMALKRRPPEKEILLWQAIVLFIYLTVHRQGNILRAGAARRVLSDVFGAAVDFNVRIP